MKKTLFYLVSLLPLVAFAQPLPLIPATQAQANAGIVGAPFYMTPATTKGAGGSNPGGSVGQPLFISPSGSDSNPGTITAPFATFNATVLSAVSNGGTVEIRGGYYSNLSISVPYFRGTIEGYAGEIPTNLFTVNLVSSNSFVSTGVNGFFTNSPSPSFSNTLAIWTNGQAGIGYNMGVPLFELNTPYGKQGSNNYYVPPLLMSDDGVTNRCFHYPLMQALNAGVASLNNSNGFWIFTNGILYIKPAVSNVMGDIAIPSTNTSDCFVYGGNAITHLTIRNIWSEFGYRNFNGSGCGWISLQDCLGYGGGDANFSCSSGGARHVELKECEFAAGIINDVDTGQGYTTSPTLFDMDNCYVHDDFYVGVHFSDNTRGTVSRCQFWGGTNELGGVISDGATVRVYPSEVANQVTYPMQMGISSILGHKSYMGVHGVYVAQYNPNSPATGIEEDDQNDTLNVFGSLFNMTDNGPGINPQGTVNTQNAQSFGSMVVNSSSLSINQNGSAAFNNPQFSDNSISFGLVVPVGMQYVDTAGTPDGVITENGSIRSATGYRGPVGGHQIQFINSSGAFLAPGGMTVTNGYASSETNTLTVTAGGLTNNTAVDYMVSVTVGTALAVKDGNGNGIFAPVLNETFPLKPGWRFTGTTVTGQAYQFP